MEMGMAEKGGFSQDLRGGSRQPAGLKYKCGVPVAKLSVFSLNPSCFPLTA